MGRSLSIYGCLLALVLSTLLVRDSLDQEAAPQKFVNPKIRCPLFLNPRPPGLEPRKGQQKRPLSELIRFGKKIGLRFSDSGLTVSEADSFYALLERNLNIRDDSFGMPSPNAHPQGPVDLRKRVMVKRVSQNEYEIFFYRIGCGVSYFYQKVIVEGGKIISRKNIEHWRESYPC